TRLYTFSPTRHIAETSLFMGGVALALAVLGCTLRDPGPPSGTAEPPFSRWLGRALALRIGAAVLGLVVRLAVVDLFGAATPLSLPGPESLRDDVLVLSLARIGLEGWRAARAGAGRAPLGDRELRWIGGFLVVLFFDLSLGPFIQYHRHEVGKGLYYYLYPYLLPLHAMRISSRIGVIVVLAVALLAGLGLRQL